MRFLAATDAFAKRTRLTATARVHPDRSTRFGFAFRGQRSRIRLRERASGSSVKMRASRAWTTFWDARAIAVRRDCAIGERGWRRSKVRSRSPRENRILDRREYDAHATGVRFAKPRGCTTTTTSFRCRGVEGSAMRPAITPIPFGSCLCARATPVLNYLSGVRVFYDFTTN